MAGLGGLWRLWRGSSCLRCEGCWVDCGGVDGAEVREDDTYGWRV